MSFSKLPQCTCRQFTRHAHTKTDKATQWLNGPGLQFKRPREGKPNWLGKTPFPMNPSFNPVPPLGQATRHEIFKAVQARLANSSEPELVVLRSISQEFSISLDRLRAIVKLKVAEEQWIKQGNALQTNFSKGMEGAMGVPRQVIRKARFQEEHHLETGGRQVWEVVDAEAGDQPILPQLLEAEKAAHKAESRHAHDPSLKRPAVRVAEHPTRSKGPSTLVVEVQGSRLGRKMEETNENQSASQPVKETRAKAAQDA